MCALGQNYLGIRIALETIPPALVGGLRYTAAGTLLIGILFLPAVKEWFRRRNGGAWRSSASHDLHRQRRRYLGGAVGAERHRRRYCHRALLDDRNRSIHSRRSIRSQRVSCSGCP